MERNLISQHQTNALKLEALREYFDFREGRPTAETVAVRSCEVPVRTVREWLGDNRNGELLDEIVHFVAQHRQRPAIRLGPRAGSVANDGRADALGQEREGAPGRH